MIKKLARNIFLFLRSVVLKKRYSHVLSLLRSEYGKRKIRVGFLVSEVSKWKGQSLYNLMDNSDDFEPIVLIYPQPHDLKNSDVLVEKELANKLHYFENSKMHVKCIWDNYSNTCQRIKNIGVDILFYQQPWDIPPAPSVLNASKYVLTFYFPYYMINNFYPEIEINQNLHHFVFRNILLNDDQVKIYKSCTRSILYAGKILGLGHPILDYFYLNRNHKMTRNYVIYAPHFSFRCDRKTDNQPSYFSSTFLENGLLILDYAQKHPNINWVFKPHPRLRSELIDYDVWSKEQVNSYYAAWEKIGVACYDSSYLDLFLESKAMITDCSSFLTEYSCTGKPLIRLIPENGKCMVPPNPAFVELYETFYNVYNNSQLLTTLKGVVENGIDPHCNKRLEVINKAGLANNYAAKNIIEYIQALLTD